MNDQSFYCFFPVLSSGVCGGLHLLGFCRLGLAYAGSNREDVLTLLLPVMGDSKSSMEVSRGGWSFRGGWEGTLSSSILCDK